MQKAYIILAHQYPAQLSRLIGRLNDGKSHFYVHIDKKVDIQIFSALDIKYSHIVTFTPREYTAWGNIGLVTAVLNAMQTIRNSGVKYDYITLLSGQDYPLKSNTEIDWFLSHNKGKNFITYHPIPSDQWWLGGAYRIEEYFVGDRRTPTFVDKKITETLNYLAKKTDRFKRKFPRGLKPYGGSQWWTLTYATMEYVLDYLHSRPDVLKFYKYTFCPDEMVFQTIILNADIPEIRNNVINDNKVFLRWPEGGGAHPVLLTATDYTELKKTDCLFARKFDMYTHVEIMNLLDSNLG